MRHSKLAAADNDSVSGDSSHSDVLPFLRGMNPGRRRREGRVRKRRRLRARNCPYGSRAVSCELGDTKTAVENRPSGPSLQIAERFKGENGSTGIVSTPPKHSFVSVDCEMVGVVGNRSSLAKCSILDYEGRVLFDEYVRPNEPILSYRTRWSGIRPCHMKSALPFGDAVERIKSILEGSTVIGHDLVHDFLAIGIRYPYNQTRDTAKFPPLRELAGLCRRQRPSLRNLSAALLGRKIQGGSHCSREDAQAALDIYRKYEKVWEQHLLDSTFWLDDQFWPEEICC